MMNDLQVLPLTLFVGVWANPPRAKSRASRAVDRILV